MGGERRKLVNWEAIGAVGEIAGAMAVVITLLYLARQVQHARREQQITAVRAELLDAMVVEIGREDVAVGREVPININLSMGTLRGASR